MPYINGFMYVDAKAIVREIICTILCNNNLTILSTAYLDHKNSWNIVWIDLHMNFRIKLSTKYIKIAYKYMEHWVTYLEPQYNSIWISNNSHELFKVDMTCFFFTLLHRIFATYFLNILNVLNHYKMWQPKGSLSDEKYLAKRRSIKMVRKKEDLSNNY